MALRWEGFEEFIFVRNTKSPLFEGTQRKYWLGVFRDLR